MRVQLQSCPEHKQHVPACNHHSNHRLHRRPDVCLHETFVFMPFCRSQRQSFERLLIEIWLLPTAIRHFWNLLMIFPCQYQFQSDSIAIRKKLCYAAGHDFYVVDLGKFLGRPGAFSSSTGISLSSISTTVTWHPSPAIIPANSRPITPPPTTSRVFGTSLSERI